MRLGRLPVRHDSRTLKLLDVVPELPTYPMSLAQDDAVPAVVSMFDNDKVGDCTCASLGYLENVWTCYGHLAPMLSTQEVIEFYSEVTGYTPGDDSTDRGANMLDVLKRCRNVGIGKDRRKILAFVEINHTNLDHVRAAIFLFGGVYVGASLPLSAKTPGLHGWMDTGADDVGSWGGHCMSVSRYDRTGVWFRTWGKLQRADDSWWRKYVDECYGLLSPEWESPVGLSTDRLQSYLAAL